MKVISEIDLTEFKAWSGAVDVLNDLTEDEKRAVQRNIEDAFPEGINEVTLNDFLRFDHEQIEEIIGRGLYSRKEDDNELR